jgi:N-methylhydantoinase B/oxoprolinase/acetone carboxylase alpha subunit
MSGSISGAGRAALEAMREALKKTARASFVREVRDEQAD